jgi:hypothetical protein
MKNLLRLILVAEAFFLFPKSIIAQADFDNVIKINPISLVASNFTLFYERKISECSTLQLGVNFMISPSKISGNKFSCYGFTPEYRYHISHSMIDVPGGGCIAPWFRYRHLEVALPEPSRENPVISREVNFMVEQYAIGFVLGYEYAAENHLALDFFMGPFMNTNKCYTAIGRVPSVDLGILGNNGLGFRIGCGIGYAF